MHVAVCLCMLGCNGRDSVDEQNRKVWCLCGCILRETEMKYVCLWRKVDAGTPSLSV